MGATEELLMSMADEVSDSGIDYLTIDPDTRKISVPSSENTFGVMTDKDSERKYFRCPRIVGDNLDLSQHKIYISYVSTISNVVNTFPDADGKYWCDDVAVDGDYITFSWKLSGNVFKTPGFVAFKVLACMTDGDVDKTRWNTAPAFGAILFTLNDGDTIEERYPDVINQILEKLEAIEEAGGSGYTLPIATPEKLGGVKPITKTDDMTQDVGVDENGKLYTKPVEENSETSIATDDEANEYLQMSNESVVATDAEAEEYFRMEV